VFRKYLIAGGSISALGLLVLMAPFSFDLEERYGLSLLFKLRGLAEVPPGVVIVAIDNTSVEALGLSNAIEEWPRATHARLLDRLVQSGAAVIVFDLLFEKAQDAQNDTLLADAFRRSGNVIIYEALSRRQVPFPSNTNGGPGNMGVETLIPPITPLAESAYGLAPFPLPKVPVMLSQYWTFKTSAGDAPTLPVVAFHAYVDRICDQCIPMLAEWADATPDASSRPSEFPSLEAEVRWLRETLRTRSDPIPEFERSLRLAAMEYSHHQLLASLYHLYRSEDSRHLNFYGPPGTIPTISYSEVLEGNGIIAIAGKGVFIGLSEQIRHEQEDGFYTVFSQPDGRDISGVEIAATAFGNLLQNKPVRTMWLGSYAVIVAFWGLLVGIVCRLLPAFISILGVLLLSGAYLVFAVHRFSTSGVWLPVVIPLFFQSPAAFLGNLLWRQQEMKRERRDIRQAFGLYLPTDVVDQLVKNIGSIHSDSRLVNGTCLFTDAFQYTTLAEQVTPQDLKDLMNEYFESVFMPIRENKGIVSQIVGDAVLALWVAGQEDPKDRAMACHAALDVARAVHRFNIDRDREELRLPTRIGLHSGQFLLGSVGAVDHFEWRPTGDIVNTASRIEGLNKYLGTQILVSREALSQVEGFLTRHVGSFVFAGKSQPVDIYELISPMYIASSEQKDLCRLFDEGLQAYRRKAWTAAIEKFRSALHIRPGDGPSTYFMQLCETFKTHPPNTEWNDGIIFLEKK